MQRTMQTIGSWLDARAQALTRELVAVLRGCVEFGMKIMGGNHRQRGWLCSLDQRSLILTRLPQGVFVPASARCIQVAIKSSQGVNSMNRAVLSRSTARSENSGVIPVDPPDVPVLYLPHPAVVRLRNSPQDVTYFLRKIFDSAFLVTSRVYRLNIGWVGRDADSSSRRPKKPTSHPLLAQIRRPPPVAAAVGRGPMIVSYTKQGIACPSGSNLKPVRSFLRIPIMEGCTSLDCCSAYKASYLVDVNSWNISDPLGSCKDWTHFESKTCAYCLEQSEEYHRAARKWL
ncbi:hypothetical protein B0H19DRAFT_1231120 [Mycena capillaripes]|nr:hypothetical protein B0H19DRAFT_1231120 [Mycena capillaripes]